MSDDHKHRARIFLRGAISHRRGSAWNRPWPTTAQPGTRAHCRTPSAISATPAPSCTISRRPSRVKAFLDCDRLLEAQRCLNNASEHFIKLGSEPGETAVLRVLADVYAKLDDTISALRCLERVVQIDSRYHLAELNQDSERLTRLRHHPQ